MAIFSLRGTRPDHLGVSGMQLAPCPASPNCVSSDAKDTSHRVEPLSLAGDPEEAWRVTRDVISRLPRTQVITSTDDYLHAECESAILGFVDDLELQLRSSESLIAVRSGSRLGYSDLGVNRKRVETLRSSLLSLGILR